MHFFSFSSIGKAEYDEKLDVARRKVSLIVLGCLLCLASCLREEAWFWRLTEEVYLKETFSSASSSSAAVEAEQVFVVAHFSLCYFVSLSPLRLYSQACPRPSVPTYSI